MPPRRIGNSPGSSGHSSSSPPPKPRPNAPKITKPRRQNVLMEIRRFQRTTNFMIPRLSFARVVRKI